MHQPTLRVIEILNYIINSPKPQRLADIHNNLSIPKSTLVPILQTLCVEGYLFQNKMGGYSPGAVLFSFASQLSGKIPFMDFVRQKLCALVDRFGETCYFGVLDGGDVLYLDKADSIHPLRMLISTGMRLPAYSTGIGKALLCDMTKSQLETLYPAGLAKVTDSTITSFDSLSEQLKQAREAGFSCEIEESTPHIRCFGVPVRRNGIITAAVSIAVPVFRYTDDIGKDMICELKKTAAEIEAVICGTDLCLKGDF